MLTAIKSGKTGLAEQRYVLQTQKLQSWWPWGSLRIVALALVYLYGTTLAAPQAAAEVRRGVLDWLGIDAAQQHLSRVAESSDVRTNALNAASATGNEADGLVTQEMPEELEDAQRTDKAQQ